ncbi:MAG: transposase, partial [Alteromonadaceae bacterium]
MPLWYESLSGNSSDKANVHDSIAKVESFKSNMALAEDFLWVADSALYSKDKLKKSLINWLTRIPQTKNNAKMLVNQDSKDIEWDKLGNGYKGVIYDPLASGERWALLFSKQAYKRELITFNRRIDKAFVKEEKA